MTFDLDTDASSPAHGADPSINDVAVRALRRSLGAYYTPDRLSEVVAAWAIQSPSDRVLEPGFGGCGFLVASKARLEALGQQRPHDFIHGCDVDEAAFHHLKEVFNAEPSEQHFPKLDFLETRAGETWRGSRFNVALGNPPYVSYQALGEKRALYQARLKQSGWPDLSARASLWAYFVLHALSFLERGGRVAWVLPGSFIRADYSRYVRDVFRRNFKRAAYFHVHERLFTPAGAGEETVVFVAEGYGAEGGLQLEEYAVETVEDLSEALGRWHEHPTAGSVETKITIANVLDHVEAFPTIALATAAVTNNGPSRARDLVVDIDISSPSVVGLTRVDNTQAVCVGRPPPPGAGCAGQCSYIRCTYPALMAGPGPLTWACSGSYGTPNLTLSASVVSGSHTDPVSANNSATQSGPMSCGGITF